MIARPPHPFSCYFQIVAKIRGSVARRLAAAGVAGVGVFLLVTADALGAKDVGVFAAPDAVYAEPLGEGARAMAPETTATTVAPADAGARVLRTLHVEERAGVARRGEWVRVPVFFAAGECPSLDELTIEAVDVASASPGRAASVIPWQADDVRNGPDGGVSRVHLWFAADLAAGEKRQWRLVRRSGETAAPRPADIPVNETNGAWQVITDGGTVTFGAGGEWRGISRGAQVWDFSPAGLFPRVLVKFPKKETLPAADVILDRATPGREVSWASGPLFAKLRVRLTQPGGVALEQEYRIPRDGREVVVTTTLFPGDRVDGAVRDYSLLESSDALSAFAVQKVPAGVRPGLRTEHAYAVTALTRASSPGALLAVPVVIGGSNGTWSVRPDGRLALNGNRGLTRGSEGEKKTLFAFWTEVRLVPAASSTPDAWWETYREHVQPLVAIVEEPGASLDGLHLALRDVVKEMKPIGWRQEAGRALVLDDPARVGRILKGGPQARESDAATLVRGARAAEARLTKDGARKLREDEKGKAYGSLDPYHLTYTQSAAAALEMLGFAPPSVGVVNLAMARGVHAIGARVDRHGHPYIDCFSRTLNMQMGPVLFGLTSAAKAGDMELVRFYRDLATSAPVQGIFGRGQRPYSGAPGSSDQSDFLYQAICDFWLRSAEILGNENLGLHPLAYSRYTDCIDVLADRYHGVAAQDKENPTGVARANFFRGQTHTHRWLGWSCAPFIRLLEDPAERGAVGLTEAIHFAQSRTGRWKNWPDLTYYVLADVLVREALSRYQRPALPAPPEGLAVKRDAAGAQLTWPAVAGAAEYRVYRTENAGGPYRWLNSRYEQPAPAALTEPRFHDPESTAKSRYVVTAVDGAGRESAWPAAAVSATESR